MITKESKCIIWALIILFGFTSNFSVCSFNNLSSYARRPRRQGTTFSQRNNVKSVDVDSSVHSDSHCDLCIIGGGISGLSAAITAASKSNNNQVKKQKIVLFEAQSQPGGRVVSEYSNGYTLDVGYAVFVENYPQSIKLLDYDALQLKQYEPGALIKRRQNGGFARIADPLRQPSKMIGTITSPVGKMMDKIRLLPLFYYVKTRTVEEIFQDEEIDTLSCLRNKYKFSDDMIQEFFEPFLKGIYFSSLDEQSSRMFHFVFKMFADGAASLPTGGMQAVSNQLMQKAVSMGVDIRLNHGVKNVNHSDGSFVVMMDNGECMDSKSVICATDYRNAKRILSGIPGLESLSLLEQQPQRSIGCMYYTFSGGETPVKDAVLILNGEGHGSGPCLTVSFLHVVNDSYAPANGGICSVSIPSDYMEQYVGRQEELDELVRGQLGSWWPDYSHDIRYKWKLEKIYDIKNAQPAQYFGPQPANFHGGRDPSQLQGKQLPEGLYVCGDYMATATLNGAIESGVNAATIAMHCLATESESESINLSNKI